jgi:hypothetical protein
MDLTGVEEITASSMIIKSFVHHWLAPNSFFESLNVFTKYRVLDVPNYSWHFSWIKIFQWVKVHTSLRYHRESIHNKEA